RTIPDLVAKWNTDVWYHIIKSFQISPNMKKRDIVDEPNFKATNGYSIDCYDAIGRTQVLIEREKDRFYLALNCSSFEPDEYSSKKHMTVWFGGTNGSFADVVEALSSIT